FLLDLRTNFLGQRFGADQIADPKAAPRHLVFVSRADTSRGRSNALFAERLLYRRFQHAMIGKYQMAAIRDEEASFNGNRHFIPDPLDFLDQGERIEHHTAPDHALHVLVENAGGNQMKDVAAASDTDGVAGIVPALIARHTVKRL